MSTPIPHQRVHAAARLNQLVARLNAANVTADEAIADYETSRARLYAGLTRAQKITAKRDDHELRHLGGRAEFYTALATRLALTVLVELAMAGRDDG